ncbi:MAG: FHA domain-containing protein [Polyangiales bacterium]
MSSPLSGPTSPPVLRAPSLPGVQPLPVSAPPAVAPPPLASNLSPIAPGAAPAPPASGGAGSILGPMPPLPNAPAPVMPPLSSGSAPGMPPPVPPPAGPPPAFAPPVLAPPGPPNLPGPPGPLAPPDAAGGPPAIFGPMPALNAAGNAPPVAPPPVDPYAGSHNSDPFAGAHNSDPFAGMKPPVVDPYGVMATPYGPPPVSDPFAGAGVQNPFSRTNMSPPAPPLANNYGPPPVPPRAGTGFGPAWQDPLAPVHEQPTETRARLHRAKLLVTQLDGSEPREVPLNEGENLVGREVGGIFAEDNLLSSRHATIIVQNGSAWVRDEGSRNGVYVRIPRQTPVALRDGDQFCFGRIILRFEQRPPTNAGSHGDFAGQLALVVGRDVDRNLFPVPVPAQGITLGRTRADLRFPGDGWVSGTHCQISVMGPQVMLTDVGSSNGTFVRIQGTRPVQHADAVLMGQRIFHVQLQ